MAIAGANKTSGDSTTNNVQTITTASTTPVNGALYVYALSVYRDDSVQPGNPTVTGTNGYSGTWTQLGTKLDYDVVATSMGSLVVFWSIAVSGVAGTVSANFGSAVIDSSAHSLDEFTGINTTTPFPQTSAHDADQTSPEDFNALGAMVNSDSRTYGVRAKNNATDNIYTVEAGWAKLTDRAASTPSVTIATAWSNTAGADQDTAWTHALGGLSTGGFLAEIAAAAAAADPQLVHYPDRIIYS